MTLRRGGYTLADLIAVITIVFVLAAFIAPVFLQARERSGPGCLSNMKQLALGMMQYSQDYDGAFPPENRAQTPGGNWDDVVFPYVKVNRILRCPSAEKPEAREVAPALVRHYAINAKVYGRRVQGPAKPGAVMRFPATTVSLCEVGYQVRELRDRNWVSNWIWGPRGREYRVPRAVSGPDRGNAAEPEGWKPLGKPAATRHVGGSNYGFADGHAKWFPDGAVRAGGVPNDGEHPGFGL